MSVGSPHLYRLNGRNRGVPDEVLEAAIAQAARVEQGGYAPVLSLGHLAHQTGASYSYLRGIVARRADPYHSFEVRRRNNPNPRLISSPEPVLMCVQRWILQRIVSRAPNHSSSYAYQTGKCIRQCAGQHLGSRWMIKLDLHDFFHSIDERQVYDVFLNLGYAKLPAFEIARICTRQGSFGILRPDMPYARDRYSSIPAYSIDLPGFLPQGAPTSGALANLTAFNMDERISAIAAGHGLIYTRYADDIVLSGTESFSRPSARQLIHLVDGAVRKSNFALHAKKTRIVPPGARHIVLGLLVDGDRVRLSRQMRMRIETHVYGVEKFGLAEHKEARGFSSAVGLARHIDGLLAFAYDIDPEWASQLRTRWEASLRRDAFVLAPESISDIYVRRYSTDFLT